MKMMQQLPSTQKMSVPQSLQEAPASHGGKLLHTWAGSWEWSCCCQHSTHSPSPASPHHSHTLHPEKWSLSAAGTEAVNSAVNAIIKIINLCTLCEECSLQLVLSPFGRQGLHCGQQWQGPAAAQSLSTAQQPVLSHWFHLFWADSAVPMISTARSKLVFTESQNHRINKVREDLWDHWIQPMT